MSTYLFVLFISFLVNLILIIPFINFLYKMKIQRTHQKTKDVFDKPTPIFDKFNQHKTGVPVGGGILIVISTSILFLLTLFFFTLFNKKLISNYPAIGSEIKIILFTFISFALLGIYDDLTKIFFWKRNNFFGLRVRHKFILETILALIVSFWLFWELKIDIIHIPFVGVFKISHFYILFATFVIVAFANAVNVSDGLDGLAGGVLMISISSFWIIARSIVDVPTSLFTAIWLGGLVAFIYFNIPPARLILGDTGALSFGATFAVIGLILGKAFALVIIGGIFFIEILSSLMQIVWKKFFKKKFMPVAPYHLYLQYKGWEESKIVMRFWIISILFAIFGLMIAFSK